uniref:Taste receptor type 2 n=1 Tax=Castor canadensis TaxID=51338 RepID=A0A8B7TXC9_CASCN|nr:taste receptor type 2 member 1 [Castor canadensis]
MTQAYYIIHLLLGVIQFFTGIFANGIIVMVNIIDLIKHRKMAPLDLLLSCLAASRIFLQTYIFFVHLLTLSLIEYFVFTDNLVVLMLTNELGLWFATWLCVFYCIKIATISHPLFLWLKIRISKLVPWLILGSLLHASVNAALHYKYTRSFFENLLVSFFSKNATRINKIEMYIIPFSFLVTGLTLPLFIFLISILLLIFSLGRHTQQMRTTVAGTRNPSRSAHTSAMLSILSFLILYFSHYMVAILLCSQVLQFGSHIFVLCIIVGGAYPCMHSIILILGNPKLKQNAKMFLFHSRCCQ